MLHHPRHLDVHLNAQPKLGASWSVEAVLNSLLGLDGLHEVWRGCCWALLDPILSVYWP